MNPWTYIWYDEEFSSSAVSGKWLAFFSPKYVAEWWDKISDAVEAGRLGPAAKVSNAPRNGKHVICVYAWDYENDRQEVDRIREELLRYCGVDTMAMVRLKEELRRGITV